MRQKLFVQAVTLLGGTSLKDVQTPFAQGSIGIVTMGAGIDLETRLEIVRHIFIVSNSTTVHVKDFGSGPLGMLPVCRHDRRRVADLSDIAQQAVAVTSGAGISS